jgi:hypothetical protein
VRGNAGAPRIRFQGVVVSDFSEGSCRSGWCPGW